MCFYSVYFIRFTCKYTYGIRVLYRTALFDLTLNSTMVYDDIIKYIYDTNFLKKNLI